MVFVGVATIDTIALVAGMPGPDERVVADDIVQAGGGPAGTAAVAAARLGVSAAFVGAVGDDEDGERILAGLAGEGVDVSGAVRVAGARSAASIGLLDGERNTRALINRPGPPLRIAPASRAAELLAGAAWVHTDHAGWGAVAPLRGTAGFGRPADEGSPGSGFTAQSTGGLRPPADAGDPVPGFTAGFRLSVDAGNPIPGFTARGADLYVPTLDALRARYGPEDTSALLSQALAEGAGCVVVTCGGDGVIAAGPDGRQITVPALAVPAVSTLGAGDVFHGALLAAIAHGLPLPRQMAYASAVAGLSCRALDGRSGIPGHAEALAAASSLEVVKRA
jgi:sulfofructose kinase